jgi:hypothetical protein
MIRARSIAMKPRALALGAIAIAVVFSIVVLWFALGSDARDTTDAKDVRTTDVPKITQADPGNTPEPARTRVSGTGTRDAPPRAPATDYMVGGAARIRDHRSGARTEDAVPAPIHPPGSRKIPSQLTSAIAQQVRAVMTECAASLPAHARGADPRLEGTIAIAIKDQRATVTRAAVQLRDVSADAAQPIAQCIEQKSVGVATSAGDEADLEAYSITLAFRLL